MRCHPHLYEVNAQIFLRRVCEKYRRTVTLSTVPEEEWQSIKRRGFDLIWFMGVWQRSPGARRKALLEPALRREYDQALPGWTDEDVGGSPFAVYTYSLDPALGRQTELSEIRAKLNRHGLGILLDFVPNNLAWDHPWTFSHPDWFVRGSDEDARAHPDWFFSPDGSIHLAHGRDPNFPPWTDTVQVNFYSAHLRQALLNELLRIADVADGVRCDMAMLALNGVFQRVWGEVVKDYPQPTMEFWAEAIEQVKGKRTDFLFLAEVYWGFEPELQRLGFDFTYDKSLYDRLRFSTPDDIRRHLMADGLYHRRSAHFTENHDEPRAIAAFGGERSLAAAMVLATTPGLRLFHDGQLEGRRIRLPVQLRREPPEVDDPEIVRFYHRLLAACDAPVFHDGVWELLETSRAEEGNESHHNLLAWSWRYAEQLRIVVVNYSSNPAQGWLKMPPLGNAEIAVFRDELTGEMYIPDANELRSREFYVDLSPWQAHLLEVAKGHP